MQDNKHGSLSFSQRAVLITNGCIEAILLLMVCVSPWAYGAVGADAKLYLLMAVVALLAIWLLRLLFSSGINWKHCPVAMCLAGTLLLGLFQICPLNAPLLRAVAPGTASLMEQLLPTQAEQFQQSTLYKNVGWESAGSMVSLYPGETRNAVFYLLAVLLLFLVVRNNPLNAGAPRRLCIALLVNGSALALFALIQFFSTPERGKIYWSYQSQGTSFGPFINRNHFAFYMNLCLGPSLGLLLACRSGLAADASLSWPQRALHTVRELLLTPASLWIGCGVSLMLASIMFCLSRGGVLAMLSGAAICLLLAGWIGARNLRVVSVLLAICLAFGLLMWFGFDAIETRMGTLWTGEALKDGRVYLLSHSWPLISQFPLLGTGMGTFQFVEPLALHAAGDVGSLYEHAHNDYLEDLIEGGLVRLALRLAAIGFIFAYAFNAYRRHIGTANGALVLGLLFAFTSVVVHSFFEFGLYVAAIAVLATVICGQICNLGDREKSSAPPLKPEQLTTQRFSILAAVAGVVLVGWLFWTEGKKAIAVRDLEQAMTSQETTSFQLTAEEDLDKTIPLTYEIANLYPFDATKRLAVAEVHFYLYERLTGQENNPLAKLGAQRQLETALQHTLHARNLCPILAEPHARLAAHREAFALADSKSAYMNRAKRLAPADAHLWYLCGLQELTDNQFDSAWESWKQSLSLSEVGLPRILDRALVVLTPEQMLEKLIPNRPEVLLAAAMYFYPDPQSDAERVPFLERALAALPQSASTLTASDLQTKATICRLLDRKDEAVRSYQASIAANPEQIAPRLELATLLLELDKPAEARYELQLILGLQPSHQEARALLEEMDRQPEKR